MLSRTQDSEEIIERVAALDIGKAELTCCVRVPDGDHPGARLQEVQAYPTMTRSVLRLSDRLAVLGVTRVVMVDTVNTAPQRAVWLWGQVLLRILSGALNQNRSSMPHMARLTGNAHDALPRLRAVACSMASSRPVQLRQRAGCSARPRWPAAARHHRADRPWRRG